MKVLALLAACLVSAANGSAVAWPGAIDVSSQVAASTPAVKAPLYLQPGTKSFAFSTTQFLHALPFQRQFLAYSFPQFAAPTLDNGIFGLPLLGSSPFSGHFIYQTAPLVFNEKPNEGPINPPKSEGDPASQTSTEAPQQQPPASIFPSFPSSSQDFPSFPQIQIPDVFPPNFPQIPQIPNFPQIPQFPAPSNPQSPQPQQPPQPSAPAESTPVDNTNLSFNDDDTVSIESA